MFAIAKQVSTAEPWWVGISDSQNEGTFRYLSNGVSVPFVDHVAPWFETEPNDGHGKEDCVDMSKDSGEFNDIPCNEGNDWVAKNRFSICEYTGVLK